MNMIESWYEVWVDESPEIPYALFLCPDTNCPGGVLIIDLNDKNRVIQRFPSYEEAVLWLQEDEYLLVKGRMEIEY